MTRDFAELSVTEAKVDDKMRVAIPASFFKILEEFFEESEESKVYLTLSPGGCIVGYPPSVWKERRLRLEDDAAKNPDDEAKQNRARAMVGMSSGLVPDKQNRILLSNTAAELTGIEKKKTAKFVGQRDHFEIWEDSRYKDFLLKSILK